MLRPLLLSCRTRSERTAAPGRPKSCPALWRGSDRPVLAPRGVFSCLAITARIASGLLEDPNRAQIFLTAAEPLKAIAGQPLKMVLRLQDSLTAEAALRPEQRHI